MSLRNLKEKAPELHDKLYEGYREAEQIRRGQKHHTYEAGYYKGVSDTYDKLMAEVVDLMWGEQKESEE